MFLNPLTHLSCICCALMWEFKVAILCKIPFTRGNLLCFRSFTDTTDTEFLLYMVFFLLLDLIWYFQCTWFFSLNFLLFIYLFIIFMSSIWTTLDRYISLMLMCFCVFVFPFHLTLTCCVCLPPPSTAEPLPLMDLCRRVARVALGRERIHHIDSLPLPQTLKNYLQYQWPHTHAHARTQKHTPGQSDARLLFWNPASSEKA